MRHFANLPPWLLVALGLSLGTPALVAETAGHPYLGIASSNVFRLKAPLRTPPPVQPVPLTKVKLVGITTLGDRRALLKVYLPTIPPEPAKEVSYILAVGQRDGPIEVLDIDEVAGTVKVNNSGTVMVLTFEKESPRPQTRALPMDLPPMPPTVIGPVR
jgi:hypothetical protein